MPSFTQNGTVYEYLKPEGFATPDEVRSWVYGEYPKVLAAVPLAGGGTVDVYGHSTRWGDTHISVTWVDDNQQTSWAWIPKENVRRATDSEWDIDQYRRCADVNRSIRWGNRLPGFLPAD